MKCGEIIDAGVEGVGVVVGGVFSDGPVVPAVLALSRA